MALEHRDDACAAVDVILASTTMHKLLAVALLSIALSACSKNDVAPPTTPSAVTPSCPAGGTPRAEAKECGAVFQECCFADGAAACAAAGCGDQCLQQESWPVQVSCAAPEATPPTEGAVK